jgi:hypothetical protein
MGDRSVPIIVASGKISPIWTAQSPIPVAISRMFFGGLLDESGAIYSLPFIIIL